VTSADDTSDEPFSPTVKSAGGLFFVARRFVAGTFGCSQLRVFHTTHTSLSQAMLDQMFIFLQIFFTLY